MISQVGRCGIMILDMLLQDETEVANKLRLNQPIDTNEVELAELFG